MVCDNTSFVRRKTVEIDCIGLFVNNTETMADFIGTLLDSKQSGMETQIPNLRREIVV
jgi:hypothetical protein